MTDGQLQDARQTLIDALGRQLEFWGFGRVMGRLWGLLYLHNGPMTLDEMAAALGISKGNASTQIRNLERFGMVHKVVRKGDRRDFWEAETDFWKMIRTILRQRQKREFDETFDLVRRSIALAESAPSSPDRDFVLRRLRHMQSYFDTLDRVVEAILAIDAFGLSTVRALLEGMRGVIGRRGKRRRTVSKASAPTEPRVE